MDFMLRRTLASKNTAAIIITSEDGVKTFCCVECPFRSEEKDKLELHLLVHKRGYRFLCGICGSGLKRREHYDRHTAEHEEIRPYICSQCGKGFKRKEHMNIHFYAVHIGNKNQECSICKKTFYRKDHLQKHIQIHNKLFLKQNIFPLSDPELDIKIEVMDDLMNVNGEEIDTEVQNHYGNEVTFDTANNSIDNTLLQVGTEERPYVCLVCNKTYKRRDHLKMHSVTHMKKDKVCSECGKAFHKDEQLLEHMNSHLQLYSKDTEDMEHFKSQLCDQSDVISDKQGIPLKFATRYTEERRPHECEVCHRRFKRRQHLKVHMNIHLKHKAKEENVWSCSFCNEIFENHEQYVNHTCKIKQEIKDNQCDDSVGDDEQVNIPLEAKKENKYPMQFVEVDMKHSQDIITYMPGDDQLRLPVPQRVYVCKYCSKSFKRKDHYKIHLHIHTGIKSFFCTDCGKGFYRKDHMQKHMQVHTKAKSKPKRSIPDLYPIRILPKKTDIKPEITIHAPSNAKLRLPLQIKVPYQMVLSNDNGEQHAVTIDPDSHTNEQILL